MHYYFHTRDEIYDCLLAETHSIVADCIAQAKRENTLLNQLSTFVTAAYRSGFTDRSMMQFTVTARLESHRSPSLRDNPGPVVSAVQGFYTSMVDEAMREARSHPAPMRLQWRTCCWRCSWGWASMPVLFSIATTWP